MLTKGIITSEGRECSYCGVYKPWAKFHRHSQTLSGYKSACKICTSKHTKERDARPGNKQRKHKYFKEYDANPENRKLRRKRQRAYYKINRTNTQYRLSYYIGNAIRRSLRGNKNGYHWEELVGYTVSELRSHLESQFESEMTWDNYGEWHIDHILPAASFTFETAEAEAFQQCWVLSNLMPRWATTEIAQKYGSIKMGNVNKHITILNQLY